MNEQQPKPLKTRTLAAILWKLLENGATQGIVFLVTIILARLIDPTEYGALSITVIFTSIAGVFVQRGFSMSLVQKKDADELDFNSVFYFSLLIAGVLYAALWFAAPWIAVYYSTPQVVAVLRAIALILFTGAVNSVQSAIIMRDLAFKKRFFVSLVSVVLSGTIGITMALLGKGVWALVAQQLTDNFVMCIGLWIATGWRPKRMFSLRRLGALFSFGWKLLASSLLETIYSDLSGLIIGRRYSTAMLAHYDKGRKFPQLIGTNITGAIQAAMFPTFSIAQNDRERLLNMLRKSVSVSAFIIFPLMAGLGAVATPMIRLVLTEKWMPCVPFLRLFCVTFAMYPVDATVLQAINALGRSDIYLRLEIVKKIVGIALIAAAVFFFDSAAALACALAVTAVVSVVCNAVPIRRLVGYSFADQCRDTLPSLAISLIMGSLVYCISSVGLGDVLTLALQVLAGVVIYLLLAKLCRIQSFAYTLATIRESIQKKKINAQEENK